MGKAHDGSTLVSFGVNPGGYVGFYNPESGNHETFAMSGDGEAARRIEIKGAAEAARRGGRHKETGAGVSSRIALKLAKRGPKSKRRKKAKAKARSA